MNRSASIWIIIAVLTVAGAVVAAGAVKDTRDRVLKIERETCRTEASCQMLLNRLLRFASQEQKKAIVESLPNIKERLKRQIRRDRPKPAPTRPGTSTPAPGPQPKPEPVPGPPGPQGEPGPPGRPAPTPEPVTPTVPEPPVEPPETPEPLPPLPEPVCDLLPSLCPPPD